MVWTDLAKINHLKTKKYLLITGIQNKILVMDLQEAGASQVERAYLVSLCIRCPR